MVEGADRRAGLAIVAAPCVAAELGRIALAAGCDVAVSGTPAQVQAWLASCDDKDEDGKDTDCREKPRGWLIDDTIVDDEWLAQLALFDVPLLLCDESMPLAPAARELWGRRLQRKLEELAGLMAVPSVGTPPAAVWVLAASTGGPAAVSDFLAALAPGLPIAFVYAQHIEASFDRQLASGLGRHQHYEADLCGPGQQLRAGRILVVPADRQVRFLPFDRVVAGAERWDGPYQPVIDQVIAELARLYGQRCGAIVFSGLCDDGALGCRILHRHGGDVWVQAPESCVSPDMPQAALATGKVSFAGTPRELATALNRRYGSQPAAGASPAQSCA